MAPLYVGGVPQPDARVAAADSGGLANGFVGCVGRLSIGGREVDLHRRPARWVGVASCDTCSAPASACENGGVCQEDASSTGFRQGSAVTLDAFS